MMKVKQPAWASMPVLDVRALSDEVICQLTKAYNAVCEKELTALAKLDTDPVRAEIDKEDATPEKDKSMRLRLL
ncbi:hypothetical protein QUF90_10605 [Desulfococcaceae bacterium HSG9]|nr:hypothetical protein [Desulfococcaceae bacterium HSG9]